MNQSQNPTMLILGGARSGKSAFAESLCEASTHELHYIATSPRFNNDAEMRERIQLHQTRRGPHWNVHEEEIDLTQALQTLSRPGRAILVDCLTLWLNNLIFRNIATDAPFAALTDYLKTPDGPVIFISNEIGQGVVPPAQATRQFRDEQGRLNQIMAKACDRVVEVRAGLPVQLKPSQHPAIRL